MTDKEFKLYLLLINDREFYANLLVIEGEGYNMIIDRDQLSIFHVVRYYMSRNIYDFLQLNSLDTVRH